MYIDLRSDKLYNPEHQQLYNRIARRNRKAFTNFIGEISKYYKDNLDWWVSMPPSRHIYTSQLFHYYCSLILVRLLLKQKKSNLIIITDSKAFKYVLEKYFAQNKIVVDVDYRVNIAVKIKNFIKIFYLVFLIPLKHIFIFFRIKHLLKNKNNLPKDSITIIDTYIIRDDINDRYYSGLWDTLNKNERKNIYFLPFFCHPINLSTLFQKLQGSNKNFLIKENILKISDYFYAWCHCVRVFRIRINPIYFSGFNFKQLIKQELYSFNIFNSSFEAIINYLFVKRLKEKGIDVRLLIDWFENQVIDKGLILGFRKFYPRVKIKGYQGFIVTKNHLSLYPSEVEQQYGFIPDEISVIGKNVVSYPKEFLPKNNNLKVTVAPAFRFNEVWDKKTIFPDKGIFTVLIALSLISNEIRNILDVIDRYLMKYSFNDVQFWVKKHPGTSSSQLKKYINVLTSNKIQIINNNFNDSLDASNLLITTGSSSSAMNALARGVPVIVIGNKFGLIQNPIPELVPTNTWRLCLNDIDTIKAIDYFKKIDKRKSINYNKVGLFVKQNYFLPVNRKNVLEFLDFSC